METKNKSKLWTKLIAPIIMVIFGAYVAFSGIYIVSPPTEAHSDASIITLIGIAVFLFGLYFLVLTIIDNT